MNIVIYLIEDNIKDIQYVLSKLNNCAQNNKYTDNKYVFQFKPLEGTIAKTKYNCDWKFYEPGVIGEIRKKMAEEEGQGNKMGLLLDVLLTEKDLDYSRSRYYPRAGIARDIYSEFNELMPIYIISGILNFGTQSDIIMGVDLRNSYILKDSLDYPGDVYVKSMFDKYIEMIKGQGGTE